MRSDVADDDRRGFHLGLRLEGPRRLAVRHIDRVDQAVEIADVDTAALDRRRRFADRLARLVAPLETARGERPARRARLPPCRRTRHRRQSPAEDSTATSAPDSQVQSRFNSAGTVDADTPVRAGVPRKCGHASAGAAALAGAGFAAADAARGRRARRRDCAGQEGAARNPRRVLVPSCPSCRERVLRARAVTERSASSTARPRRSRTAGCDSSRRACRWRARRSHRPSSPCSARR